jgi:hypothetical protein
MAAEPLDDDEDDEIITCWCGVQGTFDELFDDALFDQPCGGSGYLDCYCGGDQCVCHHHGQEVECPGCEDCRLNDDDRDDDDDAWDEAHADYPEWTEEGKYP